MTVDWDRIVGLDLTDPFSKARRPIATAEIRRPGGSSRPRIVILPPITWPDFDGRCTPDVASQILKRAGVEAGSATLLVLDGPQALAAPGRSVRECEHAARTPGRTPDHEPEAGRPFMGYIRGSTQLFAALLEQDRWRLLNGDGDRNATLIEAFPGDAWRRLSAQRLAAKATILGRQQRFDILHGHFDAEALRLPSHDDLDAAMCAALGYWWTQGMTHQLGEPPIRDACWREGYIVTPKAPRRQRGPTLAAIQRAAQSPGAARVPWTWGYRATGAIADRNSTFEVVTEHEVLVRTVFADLGGVGHRAIPNARRICPGDRILIVHSHRGRRDWLQAVVDQPGPELPAISHHEADFPAFGKIRAPDLVAQLEQLGYRRDPHLGYFTGLPLSEVERCCDDPPEDVGAGRNAIWLISGGAAGVTTRGREALAARCSKYL